MLDREAWLIRYRSHLPSTSPYTETEPNRHNTLMGLHLLPTIGMLYAHFYISHSLHFSYLPHFYMSTLHCCPSSCLVILYHVIFDGESKSTWCSIALISALKSLKNSSRYVWFEQIVVLLLSFYIHENLIFNLHQEAGILDVIYALILECYVLPYNFERSSPKSFVLWEKLTCYWCPNLCFHSKPAVNTFQRAARSRAIRPGLQWMGLISWKHPSRTQPLALTLRAMCENGRIRHCACRQWTRRTDLGVPSAKTLPDGPICSDNY